MVNEAGIRDFLIKNLDIIEPDLKFIQKEFSLKNDLGAGGRIDILAKDKFGMFVIIEIKKSDKTARQALHELQKYIALFKTEYGLAANKCRCILLSSFEGGNSVIYTSVTTPKIQPLWQSNIEKLKHFLYGNDCWEIGTN